MPLIARIKRALAGHAQPRRRKTAAVSGTVEFLDTSRSVALLIFVATVAAIVLISFVGISSHNLPVLPNQISSVRIVASATFRYRSEERTRLLREQMRDRVPPVYRLESAPLTQFEAHLHEFLDALDAFQPKPLTGPMLPGERLQTLAGIVETFNRRGSYQVNVDDVVAFLRLGDAPTRRALAENALTILRDLHAQGIQDSTLFGVAADNSQLAIFQIARDDGSVSPKAVESMEEALTFLRVNLAAEGIGRQASFALFRLFKNGLTPNLVFDRDATHRRQEEAIRNLRPVEVTVVRGQTIIEPGAPVTPEQYEMLAAQRDYLLENGDLAMDEDLQLFGRILLVLGMLLASVLYIRMEDPETLASNGRLGLLALVVILNLALVRATYAFGSLPFFIHDSSAASILPYIAPAAIAPLIVALLIDAGSAIFMALLIAIFTSVIYGSRLDLLVLTFVASMVAIFFARHTRKRSKVVRASTFGGLTVALFVFLIGVADQQLPTTVFKQMGAGLGTGLLTGVLVVGLLPVLESLFKRTTDITLLELTDYNHPLLRRMQLEAPGTYHHSLIVAQLSENAASEIGANPLLARVCALFHDIGKTSKPAYFTENQRDGINPHDDNNPSLSALIIKSHVKDGVDLALKHKLPRAVIDVIQQHHGTSLIRYFFHRALSVARPGNSPTPFPGIDSRDPLGPGLAPTPVSETTYRYDGPLPQFKESAIIHLADSVEAASRSLRKVTPQHLTEIIEQIVRERLADNQLDEAPITLDELTRIKTSFAHTLFNMLHGRVAYPAEPHHRPVELPTARSA